MTPEKFRQESGISTSAFARIEAMDRVLIDWSERHNLIARSTIEDRWERHYLDSAQLAPIVGAAVSHLVDLGSGAGFPGLILAAILEDVGGRVTLIESRSKKAAFLREAGKQMGLSTLTVIPQRIESVSLSVAPDAITARALAPLNKLLGYAHGIAGKNTKYVFPKGQDVEVELTEASKCWHMSVKQHPSRTSPDGTILEIGNLARVEHAKPSAHSRRR